MERNIMRKVVQLLKCKRAVQLNLIIKLDDYWIIFLIIIILLNFKKICT